MATKLLEIRQAQHALITRQFELVSKLFHQGLRTKKDYLGFKAELGRAEIDLLTTRNSIEKAKTELGRLTAADGPSAFATGDTALDPSTIPVRAPDITAHYEYRAASLSRHISDLETSLVSRKRWPEVFLNSGASYKIQDYLGPSGAANGATSWNALLALKYNIWDWGTRSRDTSVALEKKAIQDNELDARILAARTESARIMLDLAQLKEHYHLSDELLRLVESNFELIEKEYRQGRVTYIDFVTELKNLASARSSFYTVLFDLKGQLAQYRYQEGTLYETLTKK